MDRDIMRDVQIELMDYATIENNEVGEAAFALADMWDHIDGYSEEFIFYLEQEMRTHLDIFRTKTKKITRYEPQPDRVIVELVWEEDTEEE